MSLAVLRRQKVHLALHTCFGKIWIVTQNKLSTFRLITYQAVVNPLGGTYHELTGSRAQLAQCPTTRRRTPIWVSVVRVPEWNTGERIAVLLIRKPSQQITDRYIAVCAVQVGTDHSSGVQLTRPFLIR